MGKPTYWDLNKKKLQRYYKRWYKKNKGKVKANHFRNREHIKNKAREYQKLHKQELYQYSRKYRLRVQYGITPEDYDQLLINQHNCCAICKTHTTHMRKDISIDHDHITGKVRGLLCETCNMGLGLFQDSKILLKKAYRYLDNFSRKK